MKLPRPVKWAVIILLLAGIIAGGGACWLWIRSDQLIHQAVLDAFARKAPGWDIALDRTRFDGTSRLHLHGLTVRHPETGVEILRIPEVIVSINRDTFLQYQQLELQHIHVRKPEIKLTRNAQGEWNWSRLPPLRMAQTQVPEWKIEGAQFDVLLEHGPEFPDARFRIGGGDLQLIPSSRRAFDFEGVATIDGAGPLGLNGNWDVDRKRWSLTGSMKNVIAGDDLMQLASGSSPQIRERLAAFDELLHKTVGRDRAEVRTADADGSPAVVLGSGQAAPSFGVAGLLDINFDVISDGPDQPPEYRMLLGIRDGTVTNSVLPFALHEVNARWYRDNNVNIVQVDNASNDQTRIQLQLELRRNDAGQSVGFVTTDIRSLPLDDRLNEILPAACQKILRPLHATGTVDVEGTVRANGSGQWIPEGVVLRVHNAATLYEKFQYPVDGINGAIAQREGTNIFDIKLNGNARGRPVAMTGGCLNPGPAAEMFLELTGTDFPIDGALSDAFDPRGQDVIDSLSPTGLATGTVTIHRPPGLKKKTVFTVDASVRQGTMRFRNFPYPIAGITGAVKYHSATRSWTFTNFAGVHDDTRITAGGSFAGQPGRLQLDIDVREGTFDGDLRSSLGSGLRDLWDHLSPTGRFDVDTHVDWTAAPGQSALVTLTRAVLRDGHIMPASFPYAIDNISAEMSFVPVLPDAPDTGKVTITTFQGNHGRTSVNASGWSTVRTNGDWALHFDRLLAQHVVPDRELRDALPEDLRAAFNSLNPTVPFGIENCELEFRGWGDPTLPVTAAWSAETVLSGGTISAGMDLKKVRGRVTNRGEWNGRQLLNEGEVRLDSVEVLDHRLTNVRGPYRIVDDQLTIGSAEVFLANPKQVPAAQRITATAFGGRITCDALVSLAQPGTYRVFTTATNADLRNYAQIHMPREKNLDGKINAWLYLYGVGSDADDIKGSGQLQISPAALYELPVVVQLFNALGTLNLAVPDRTAFRYALLNFRLMSSQFVFDQIELVGQSMALTGRGNVGFDSRVALDFYSKPQRTQSGIPIIGTLVSGATSNWVNVRVDGSLSNPRTRVQPNINLDSLQPFLNAFNPVVNGPIPQIRIPLQYRPSFRSAGPRRR